MKKLLHSGFSIKRKGYIVNTNIITETRGLNDYWLEVAKNENNINWNKLDAIKKAIECMWSKKRKNKLIGGISTW